MGARGSIRGRLRGSGQVFKLLVFGPTPWELPGDKKLRRLLQRVAAPPGQEVEVEIHYASSTEGRRRWRVEVLDTPRPYEDDQAQGDLWEKR
jgi:hypothetical protein